MRSKVVQAARLLLIRIGLLAVLLGWVAPLYGQLLITTDTTYSGVTVSLNSSITVTHATNDPLLTLTNGTTMSAVTHVWLGLPSGNPHEGRLRIDGGSTLMNNGYAIVGEVNATGTATVSGTGSLWAAGTLHVGEMGHGIVRIEGGGSLTTPQAFVGYNANGPYGYFDDSGVVTVTGTGSTFANSGDLYVGYGNSGIMHVLDGGSLTSVTGLVGYSSAVDGSVNVSGPNSKWTNTGQLTIGIGGRGILLIDHRGAVISGTTYIGDAASSHGTVTLDNGSTWNANGDVAAGWNGRGDITVAHASVVDQASGGANGDLIVGRRANSRGTVTIESGSRWLTTHAAVGNDGDGVLEVRTGGELHALDLRVGEGAESGSILATGVGSRIVVGSGESLISDHRGGSGSVTVSAGAQLDVSGVLLVEGLAAAPGRLSVLSGSTANVADLRIGLTGAGALEVADSVLSTQRLIMAATDASTRATASITRSQWTATTEFVVGNRGNAQVTIGDQSVLDLTGDFVVAERPFSDGLAVVDHSSVRISGRLAVGGAADGSAGGSGSFIIGPEGHVEVSGLTKLHAGGYLRLEQGALLSTHSLDRTQGVLSHDDGIVRINGGIYSHAPGALIVSGATAAAFPSFELDGAIANTGVDAVIVGESGGRNGQLLVKGGSTLTNSGWATLGMLVYSTGMARVTGEGSHWQNSTALDVGLHGAGTLTVDTGGQVTNNWATIGYSSESTGIATVSGTHSIWQNSTTLVVGQEGKGDLIVESGGRVTNTDAYVGAYRGAGYQGTGSATVRGEHSVWQNSGALYVGYGGTGALIVDAGGQVTSSQGDVGFSSRSTGSAIVSGENSLWQNSGALSVGNSGSGDLTVEAGGHVTSTNAFLGRSFLSLGNATVTGMGSVWLASDDLILGSGALSGDNGGTGTLHILDGGLVSVGGTTKTYTGDTIHIQGGTLRTGSLDVTLGTFDLDGGTLILTGGTAFGAIRADAGDRIEGTGRFENLTIAAGGVIAPGFSPGTLDIITGAWEGGGAYEWETDGTLGDLLDFGSLTINASGQPFFISPSALVGFDPNASDQWLIAQADNAPFDLTGMSGLTLDPTSFQFAGQFSLFSGGGNTELWLSFTPVPEPGAYALMTVALLAGVVAWRRKRRGAKHVSPSLAAESLA